MDHLGAGAAISSNQERCLAMTRKQLNRLKASLVEKRLALIQKVNGIKSDLRDPIPRTVQDSGDKILEFTSCHALLSESFLHSLNLRSIEDALKRMEEGTYGRCADCGSHIETRRISAVPWALFCIQCQEREEIRGSAPAGKTPAWLSEAKSPVRRLASSKNSLRAEARRL